MRTLKFRVYDKKEKCWIHGPGQEVNLFGETIIFGGFLNGISIERLNDLVALQFTGLIDKNGKEIYEGDIVDCGLREGKCEVVFNNGGFGYYRPSSFGRTFTTNCYDSLTNCEVIGNIYENPDLIRKEKE